MNDFLLTIAIPTYNRATYLDLCLTQLCKQLNDHDNRVEVIVSDNCSTDTTPDVVKRHQADCSHLISVRNAANIGADANFSQCFNNARGKYVLLLGDDDVLVDGALQDLLTVLQDDYGVVYLRSYPFWNDYVSERPKRQTNRYVIFTDKKEFVKNVGVMFGFISGNVVNKSLVDPKLNFNDFGGTALIHLSWTFSAVFNAQKNAYIEKLMIGAKEENRGGWAVCGVFGVNLNKIFRMFGERGVDCSVFDVINQEILASFLPNYILRLRSAPSEYLPEDYYATLHPVFKAYPRFWLVTYPATRLPIPVGRVWQKICKKYFKLRAFLFDRRRTQKRLREMSRPL